MTLTVSTQAMMDWIWTDDTVTLSTIGSNCQLSQATTFTNGTGWGEVDDMWHKSESVATGLDDDNDLTALTTTIYGETVTVNFASVKVIYIENTSTTSGEDLLIDATVANGFITPFDANTEVSVPAGSVYYAESPTGFTVTAGTGDILRITNDGTGAITYKIFLAGVST